MIIITKLYVLSTTIGAMDGVDSIIPWVTLFKISLTKPQLCMGCFKHLIMLGLFYVNIMFNVGFMVPRTPGVF